MSEPQAISWFPGHMAKTRRTISESIKLVDAVAEIIDARIPVSSRNPELDKLVSGKPRIVLLNKADAADPVQTERWIEYFKNQGVYAIGVDCKTGKGLNAFVPLCKKILKDKIAAWEAKGMRNKILKIMVVGIPNSGKSSFINRMSKKSKAKVEDRPGVTRGNQWFPTDNGVDLLDTPGVLWPKFDDPIVGERLAFTGAIKDNILDVETLAGRLLEILHADYDDMLSARYKIESDGAQNGIELLELIARKRGMLISGGEADLERAAVTVLDEFRGGKIGRITLEKADFQEVN
ncbi:MAG: ribosome biogenesis GTPase YlqF [Clostridia bacterium]|nr:ribosome biogenesis GTPase YlqF [Clostridia bacterium]